MENEKISHFLSVMKESMNMLREFEGMKPEEYRSDRKIQDIVERECERAIHSCIDIGARIISIKSFSPAATYGDIFDILTREKVIPASLAEKMKDLVRFRNILVHEYFRIDPEKVLEKLRDGVATLAEYAKYVENLKI